MIYPAYRLTGPDEAYRTFFWFCFARLKELDEPARKYSDYLGSEYRTNSRQPLWEFGEEKGGGVNAQSFTKLDVALHAPAWNHEEVTEILKLPVFSELSYSQQGEHHVVSIDLVDKPIDAIMYPVMLIRNILGHRPTFDTFVEKGLDIRKAALLCSQVSQVKDYRGNVSSEQISEDYVLADTFEALAHLLTKRPEFLGPKWGAYNGGYRDTGDYCTMPDDLFELGGQGVRIEDVIGDMEDNHEIDHFQVIVDSFKEAVEAVNEKS